MAYSQKPLIMVVRRNHRQCLLVGLTIGVLVASVAGFQAEPRYEADKKLSKQFEGIRKSVTTGKYDESISKLRKFQRDHPRHIDASRAALFLGKIQMAKGDLRGARAIFERTVRDYPGTLEHHKCRYKIAMIAMLQGDDQEALRLFSDLAERPDGPLAPESAAMRTYLQTRLRE